MPRYWKSALIGGISGILLRIVILGAFPLDIGCLFDDCTARALFEILFLVSSAFEGAVLAVALASMWYFMRSPAAEGRRPGLLLAGLVLTAWIFPVIELLS